MMDFALLDRDIEITNGDFALCRDEVHAMAQAITIRLRTLAGEWFLDSRVGLPYLSQILGKKHSERLLRRLIAETIKSLSNAITIKNFVMTTHAERRLTIGFTAVLSEQTTISINETIGI
jgi:hypothetical protein